MGKIKDRQSDSWKSTTLHEPFLSKNKKRKEKRLIQKFTAKQTEMEDFIPMKKATLTPLNKIKNESIRHDWVSYPKGEKKKILLCTSLPIKGSEKEKSDKANNSIATLTANINKKKKQFTGILSNPHTPKRNKMDRVTFEDEKRNIKKKFDNKAEENEESITDNVVKPCEKTSKNKRSKKPQMELNNKIEVNSSIEAEDYLDMETNKSKETSEETNSENSGTNTEDSDDFSDENTNISSFISDSELESVEDENEENNIDSEDEPVSKMKISKWENQKQKGTHFTPVKKSESTISKKKENQVDKLIKPEIPVKSNIAKDRQNSIAKMKQNPLEMNKTKNKELEVGLSKNKKKKEVTKGKFEAPSNFIGFIRKIPVTVTEKEIKSALSKTLDLDDVLMVKFVKIRKVNTLCNVFLYLKTYESLNSILNNEFSTGSIRFSVYQARTSEKKESSGPVAFLPRVPLWITNEQLKEAIEKDIGAGKITKLKDKGSSKKLQTKNILMYFADIDTLKEAISKGEFKIKDHSVIVREALEGVKIEIYRAVFANIPEKTNETTFKEVLESSIGKNTVGNIKFSFRKKSYAFVVFQNEEAQQKALALGNSLSLKGTQLKVLPYIPRKPRKRASSNEHDKTEIAEKKKRQLESTNEQTILQRTSPKKKKQEGELPIVPSMPNLPDKQQRKTKKRKNPSIPSSLGETKAMKNPKLVENKVKLSFGELSSKNSKISSLKNKIKIKKG